MVVVLGRPSLAEPADATVHAAAALAALPDVRFLSALRRGNVHGALDLGLPRVPARPGDPRRRAARVAERGARPGEVGLDADRHPAGGGGGQIRTLVLLGADPFADFPDRAARRAALAAVES